MVKSWKTSVRNAKGQIFVNWPMKLSALVLAAILWAAVAAQEETTQLVPVDLVVQPPEGRTLATEPPRIQALYAGTARELIRLYVQPPTIQKTLPDTITGSEYTLALALVDLLVPDGTAARAQRLEPRTVTIQLDDVADQVVRVIQQVTIEPDTGYQLFGSVTVLPTRITIRGPREQVEGIEAVFTVPLVMERVREPVERELAIDTSALGSVQLSQTSVRVSADVGALSERVLMGVPVSIRTDLPGRWVSDPAAVLVTVRGRTSRLADLTRDSVQVHAVLNADAADSVIALQVTAPARIAAWASPDSVMVRRESSD
ncbi:MAG: YbbR-like domain-containing protein [Gemmatimonadota bacterium]